MKTKIIFFLLLGFYFTSCNKLTEKNIIGTWECTSAGLNGITATPPPFTWVVVFNEGNTGTSTYNGTTSNMAWVLDEKEQRITIPTIFGGTQVYDVLEKKGNTLKVKYVDGTDTYEYTFEKQ